MYTKCDDCKWMSGGTEAGYCQKKCEYVYVDGCSEGETWKQALKRHEDSKVEKYLNELMKKYEKKKEKIITYVFNNRWTLP